MKWQCPVLIFLCFISIGCEKQAVPTLHPVSVEEFETFIATTAYVTDAEKFAWSIVQLNVWDYEVREHVDWRCPDGIEEAKTNFPVTQVSYNDALAYAKWTGTRLPSYEEYWTLVANDTRPINEAAPHILPLQQVNVVGNTWDITSPDRLGRIRLAGGSYLCNKSTCNGTSPERVLHVDAATGNTHISFAVVQDGFE